MKTTKIVSKLVMLFIASLTIACTPQVKEKTEGKTPSADNVDVNKVCPMPELFKALKNKYEKKTQSEYSILSGIQVAFAIFPYQSNQEFDDYSNVDFIPNGIISMQYGSLDYYSRGNTPVPMVWKFNDCSFECTLVKFNSPNYSANTYPSPEIITMTVSWNIANIPNTYPLTIKYSDNTIVSFKDLKYINNHIEATEKDNKSKIIVSFSNWTGVNIG